MYRENILVKKDEVKGVTKMIDKAILFATNAHKGMVRKGSAMPYIMHPLEAAVIVSQLTNDPELIAAALLHDTVEDCEAISIEDIRMAFGERVAALVGAESEDKTKTWEERKSHTIVFLKNQATEEVKIVALGDKLSNMRSLVRDYKSQGDKLWERFNMKDKAKIGWYYKGVGESLASMSQYPAYREYVQLVEELFSN